MLKFTRERSQVRALLAPFKIKNLQANFFKGCPKFMQGATGCHVCFMLTPSPKPNMLKDGRQRFARGGLVNTRGFPHWD
jgi:hypothetical protein